MKEMLEYLRKTDLPYYCFYCGEEFLTPQKLAEHDCPNKLTKLRKENDKEMFGL